MRYDNLFSGKNPPGNYSTGWLKREAGRFGTGGEWVSLFVKYSVKRKKINLH